MFYKMLFDRFVDFAYLYTILDMPRQIRIVCLRKGAVLCFVNNGLADKTSTEPGLGFTRNKRALTSHGFATQSGNGINDMQILSTVSCCRTFETVVFVTLQTLWNVLHDCPEN